MSLFRSQSASGGLSINTAAANSNTAQQPASSGLFGQNSTATNTTTAAPAMASAGGLFGGGAAAAKPATGGLFGSSTTNTTTPATGGGLFGGGAAASSTPAATTGGGLFGGGAAAAKPATGGLFGSSTTNTTTTPATGGGLFGGGSAQTGTTGTTQPASGGLFGNAGSTGTQQAGATTGTTTGGGLFGQAQNQTQPAATTSTTTGGLFGGGAAATNNTSTPTNTLGGGLFGASQAAKPATGGMFGASQATQTQQPQVSAVQVNYDNLRPRSRFDDLAQPVQDEIALIDKGIGRVMKMKDEITEFMPKHGADIESLGRDVKFVEQKFRAVQVALNKDVQAVKALQDMTKKNIADAQLSFKATDNLKLPTHYHTTGLFATSSAEEGKGGSANAQSASGTHASAQDLISYFNRVCDNVEKYKKRLDEYRLDIERDMPGVENGLYEQIRAFRDRNAGAAATAASLGGGSMQDQLGQILSALRETGNAIVAQAGQIADTRERLSRLQAGIVESGVYAAGMTG